MENKDFNTNQANGADNTNQANGQQPGSQPESSSSYGYSYINQAQKNPNNIWRADENSTGGSQAGGEAYSNTSSTYHNGTQADGGSAYSQPEGGYTSSAYGNTQYHSNTAYGNTQSGSNSAYNNAQSSAGNAYSNIYGTQNNSQGGFQTYNDSKKQKKEERARKRAEKQASGSSNFGMKMVKCASIALVFGLVAGTAFEGSSHLVGNLIGTDGKQAESGVKEDKEALNPANGTERQPIQQTTSAISDDDIVSIVKECKPSIVAITNMSLVQTRNWFGQVQNYEMPSAGSGIIVSSDDDYLYIATNNHVVSGNNNTLTIQFCDGATVAAEVKGADKSMDLAVVQVKKSEIEASTLSEIKIAEFGDSDSMEVGSRAIAIGNALGYGQSVTVGYISALEREVTIQDESTGETFTNALIQTDAAINPGNSGGALLNSSGQVIGINSSKYSDTDVEGIGFAIPANMAKPVIEDFITNQEVSAEKAAYLGIEGQNVTASVATTYNMPEGVFIKAITKGTAADQYGLKEGDIITKFDGREVKTMQTLKRRLSYYEAGTEVEVIVQRAAENGYQEKTLKVVLGKMNS